MCGGDKILWDRVFPFYSYENKSLEGKWSKLCLQWSQRFYRTSILEADESDYNRMIKIYQADTTAGQFLESLGGWADQ